jgi:hypothetical protein
MTGNHAGITPQPVTAAVPPAAVGYLARPGALRPCPRSGTGDVAGRRRQCTRCGAVGTHYLTCPDLRLPSGYRLSRAPRA